jgi:hypothetical protein
MGTPPMATLAVLSMPKAFEVGILSGVIDIIANVNED